MSAPRLRLREVEVFERLMPFARPFRFGTATVEAAPQAFVRVVAEVEGRGLAAGATAEMMMPKWFDKNPAKSPAETVDDLRACLLDAARAYRESGRLDTAFGHHAAARADQASRASAGTPALLAAFGPAVVDKAVLDALLRALGLDLAAGLRANVPGLDGRLAPDLQDRSLSAFLERLAPSPAVAVRHTIGLLDALDGPGGLAEEVTHGDLSFLKIKIGGDLPADLDRLRALAGRLPALAPGFRATLDANEQYDPDRLGRLVEALATDPVLAPLRERLLYIEQPFDRAATLLTPLGAVGNAVPFIIDEADGAYDAFPRAAPLGYRGVSSKSCKGLYKSLVNAARAAAWNARDGRPGFWFVTGEDLTCQAGLGVQQDTALVAALGLTHGERNGHHYVEGFGPAPEGEARAFAAAHPDLYRPRNGRLGLALSGGALPTASLFARPGFASGAEPDWSSLHRQATTAFERTFA